MRTKATFIGTVQDVQGANVAVALDSETVSGLAFIDGHGYRIGQIGSFVRVPIGLTDLFGIVSQVGAGAVPEALMKAEPYGHRWMRVQLVGEGRRGGDFKRGISQYPTIGDEAHLVTESDLARIYGRPDTPNWVRVGNVASAESIPALIDIDRLVTRHSAVLGTTGAGKSSTVANLLMSITDPNRFPSSRIIILDIHGEYHTALQDRASVFRINAKEENNEKPLFIPYWALSFDELLRVTPLRGIGERERAATIEKVRDLKRESLERVSRDGLTVDTLTVDSPVPFSIHKFWFDFYRLLLSTHTAQSTGQSTATEALVLDAAGNPVQAGDIIGVIPPRYRPHTQSGPDRIYLSQSPVNLRSEIVALGSLLRDTRYDFLFRPGPWCPDQHGSPERDLDALLSEWIGGENPITILDLSGVPVSILTNLIGALIRLLFDALFWGRYLPEGGRSRPLLFVLEEAHAYLGSVKEGEASIAVRRIVKEGRKYGLGAMIVSQRPSEIDSTILSQCGTLFAMRLGNQFDRSHVTSTVSDNLEGLFSMLPTLRTGEAIIVGEAVHLPQRVVIDAPAPNRKPDSEDPPVYDSERERGWNRPKAAEDYQTVVRAWRSENPGVE